MDYTEIRYEVADGVLTITLDRPDRLNAWTPTMQAELIDAFDRADADDDVRAIVVTGAGRAYCAGGDRPRVPRGGGARGRARPQRPPGRGGPGRGTGAGSGDRRQHGAGVGRPDPPDDVVDARRRASDGRAPRRLARDVRPRTVERRSRGSHLVPREASPELHRQGERGPSDVMPWRKEPSFS